VSEFTIGQRWISNTEAELGLGIVSAIEHRHITMSFPAAGEQRVYATNNAPLTRVQFRIGEIIRDNDGNSLTIQTMDEEVGYISYTGTDNHGNEQTWGEVELDCFVQFSKPQDRLFSGQIDKIKHFQLRYQTLQQQQKLAHNPARGLMGPRVQLLEHQLYIASEVGRRFAPRVLLADEVGLGKTIEAGLIIHQQLTNGLSNRVLIAVPDTLCHQWLVEMLRRFNLHFTLLDQKRCEALLESGQENPFESAQLVLCGISLLTDDQRLQQALACDWDLLVVDEAHHLEWHPQQQSDSYTSIEQLAAQTAGLLLLTATPEQLGVDGHFARLRLLDPDRYYDLQTFLDEQQNYQPVNELVQHLLQHPESIDNDPQTRQQLVERLGDSINQQLDNHKGDLEELRDQLIAQLLDRHGTGRVLFRNTRSAVKGFPHRRLHSYGLHAEEGPEEQFIDGSNPRVKWLVDWLKQHRRDKVLIICSSAETALDLEMHLNLRAGLRSSAFHEGLSLLERDRAAAYFADMEDGAQVLVCSEIGSEGRNFQFAHNLVMFDLPLNPDLIEQRIGRLDRIGQTQDVDIHVPYLVDTVEELELNWLHQGLNCFESVCPIGQQIYQEFADELHDTLNAARSDSHDADMMQELIERTRTRTEETLQQLQQGRDRLLELNSCKPEEAEVLIKALSCIDEEQSLKSYLDDAFDSYGVDCEKHSDTAIVVRPSDHMQTAHFPGLPDEGLTATFLRQQALSREDMHYLTWEHPMVSGVMDMVMSNERGNTSLCTIKLPPLKPGSLLVEGIFQFSCAAPKSLQIQRFVADSSLRLLVDNNLKELGHVITVEHVNTLGQQIKLATAKQLVQHARNDIERICDHLEARSKDHLQETLRSAEQKLTAHFDEELNRLKALAEVNPNIRQEEIDHCENLKLAGLHALENSQLRLDAIRVVVAT
jgi:ATP-dependent helicase HepA